MMLAMLSSSVQVADVAGHHLADRQRERRGTVLGDGAHDVALRQYAGQAPSGAADHNRADAVRRQKLRGRL